MSYNLFLSASKAFSDSVVPLPQYLEPATLGLAGLEPDEKQTETGLAGLPVTEGRMEYEEK